MRRQGAVDVGGCAHLRARGCRCGGVCACAGTRLWNKKSKKSAPEGEVCQEHKAVHRPSRSAHDSCRVRLEGSGTCASGYEPGENALPPHHGVVAPPCKH
eukprot:713586-Prorocentrum_minimum.AAC.1